MEDKYFKKASKCVDKGSDCLLSMIELYNNSMNLDTAVLKLSLCFYPDYNIRFIKSDVKTMFGPFDLWFNGDIEMGLSKGFTVKEIEWGSLIKLLSVAFKRRDLLKKLDESIGVPYNMPIRKFLIDNFVDNVIMAGAEIEEYGFSRIKDIYENFLDDNDDLKKSFMKELKSDKNYETN